MAQTEALYQLQQLDLALLKAQKRLTEIQALLADNHLLTEAKQAVETAASTLAPLRAQNRDLELEIAATIEKAEATEQELYSGSVTNTKVMQEMQQDVAALKKYRQELEDRLLEMIVQVEEAQRMLDAARARLTEVNQMLESEQGDLLREQAELTTRSEQLQKQRQTALQPISPENLKVYNTLKPRKSHQPLSLLIEGSCSVCGIEQTRNIIQETRRGEKLVSCTNCGRILVYRP